MVSSMNQTQRQTTARAIYEALQQHGPMSTTDLITLTQRNRATALAVIYRLKEAGVIKSTGRVKKTGERGRPAHLLTLNQAADPRNIPQ